LIVVGGGPAGSSAAFAAAKQGIKVAMLEKESSIAETVRTSGVTWIQNIKEFGIPEDCYNSIKNFVFYSPNNKVSIGDSVARSGIPSRSRRY
jgi:digeranylgeranylglycerophospholipid reductase